ncbi:MAG: hypothetical protein P857_401 [Candidatus Xenolissoclinum pacificiensis L6]|uniref:Uncharacterized protein n=1 Tax=Candidatus Xenolissoclinum pacificiensis L6 TaxID=1401685 RepID=W2V0V6_9RICK|nr:MAG: hypothetical protein P857_401 [Candidatus Xenolissoclinum pacificiensis L6]
MNNIATIWKLIENIWYGFDNGANPHSYVLTLTKLLVFLEKRCGIIASIPTTTQDNRKNNTMYV